MALTVRVTESRPSAKTVSLEGRLNNDTVALLNAELEKITSSSATVVVFDLAGWTTSAAQAGDRSSAPGSS
jgi:hypothetical protein